MRCARWCFLFVVCAGVLASAYDWDMLELRLMWPPSDCLDVPGCAIHDYRSFSVHVFAPTYSMNASQPEQCAAVPFDPSALDKIRDELAENWPDFFNYSYPEGFWKTQWDKHGTCAMECEELETELQYFNAAITVREGLGSLRSVLHDCKIDPDPVRSYSYNQFDQCVSAKYGHKTATHCKPYLGKAFLHEIVFCLDPSLSLIDCSEEVRTYEADRCAGETASEIYMLESW